MTFEESKPMGAQIISSSSSSAVTLTGKPVSGATGNAAYAKVQVSKAAGTFSDDTRICFYRVDGTTVVINQGFILGDNDYVIFNRAELAAGVSLISQDSGQTIKIYIQYYN